MPDDTLKVATFNANSIRSRLALILDWLRREAPDVLCVQETKVQDPDFPVTAFTEAGWHVAFRGQKAHAGAAVREPELGLTRAVEAVDVHHDVGVRRVEEEDADGMWTPPAF